MIGLTSCAISITSYEHTSTLILSNVNKVLNIDQVALVRRTTCGLVKIEVNSYRNSNELLNGLRSLSRLLISQEVLQTVVLCICVIELSTECCNLRLRESLDSINIWHLLPCSLTEIEGQT